MKLLPIALMAALASTTPVLAGDKSMTPISGDPVATGSGRVAGTRLPSGVRAYLGIPFAAPPVGALRWAPPQPTRWSGVFNADRKGAECIQVLRPHDINHYFGEEASGEDCLTLNVWAPAKPTTGAALPVIVFIYGGGYTLGSSGMANYDGEAMAQRGAIFVNFNYRVGALGFLAHPELTAEQGGASGNYGTMDQTLALRWVHDNIARFGGDPGEVLIMGQSAGARSVASQIVSPAARGLFRAGVMSSGCNFRAPTPTLAESEKLGLQLQRALGAGSLAAMRMLPADKILAAQSENQLGLSVAGVRIGGPIVDGKVIPAQFSALIEGGNYARVPIIASYNSDDMSNGFQPLLAASTLAQYRAAADALFGSDAPAFLGLYAPASDAEVRRVARHAASDAGFASQARNCAMDEAAHSVPTFIDEYARRHPYIPGVKLADQDTATVGAYHTADIPYWFGTQDKYNAIRATRAWTPWDRTMSGRMMDALIAFAATGSPTTAAMPWRAWTPVNDSYLRLGDDVQTAPYTLPGLSWLAAHPPAASAPVPRPSTPRD
ncbi:MAG: carboxylesterase family protein [Croceibacterium sp.]